MIRYCIIGVDGSHIHQESSEFLFMLEQQGEDFSLPF